jgi:hypothetical protein
MATVGAYKLLAEYDGNLSDERFGALRDAYLNLMRDMGFSSEHQDGCCASSAHARRLS